MSTSLDETDRQILAHLQQNARLSNVALASKVSLSAAACLRRVQSLTDTGVIRRYVTLLDPGHLNLGASVFIQVSLEKKDKTSLKRFEKAVNQRSEVVECYLMTGDSDYLLRVVVPNVAAFERFLMDHLTKIAGIATIKSSFTLKQIKYTTALPLDAIGDEFTA